MREALGSIPSVSSEAEVAHAVDVAGREYTAKNGGEGGRTKLTSQR